jgi:hypothetical protein
MSGEHEWPQIGLATMCANQVVHTLLPVLSLAARIGRSLAPPVDSGEVHLPAEPSVPSPFPSFFASTGRVPCAGFHTASS